MALNDSALNEEALNEGPEGEQVDFDLAMDTTVHEFGPHQRVYIDLAITGGPFYRQVAHETILAAMALELIPELKALKETIQCDLALETTPELRVLPTQHISCDLALETRVAEFPPNSVSTSQPIQASVPLGVLPMTGSALFTIWQPKHIKETRIQRHWDLHEASGLDDADTRHRWELAINVNQDQVATHWNFIKDHFGSGKAFYFYDLQANGFQYDATGVLTNGRYLCRFDTNPMPRILQEGYRFVIEYSVVEVE